MEEQTSTLLRDSVSSAESSHRNSTKRTGLFNILILWRKWLFIRKDRNLDCFFYLIWFICEGTVWTAIAHIITGVIGSGVLSLAWSVAQLGWISGPICMVVFCVMTIISSNLLCDCYRYPHPEIGPIRNRSFAEAVRCYLGGLHLIIFIRTVTAPINAL